ncbi:hypothetical protein ACFZC7_21660 [Streptomyces massasporeus]|uniref:hypothetical protein n=1 Tax=Streptomyces massasporeus TaxID=67324 RepID=UPI0036E8ECBF
MTELLTVEAICRDWHGLRRLALRRGAGPDFDRLIALARSGEQVARRVAELLDLPTGDDAAPGSPRDGYAGLPGIYGHVVDGVYVCPAGTCPREVRPVPDNALPYCGIHARDMLFFPTPGPGG